MNATAGKCDVEEAARMIRAATAEGRRMLSEYDARRALSAFGVPVVEEIICAGAKDAAERAATMGWPVVLKLCSPEVAHKKERGFVRVGLADAAAVETAANDMLARARDVRVDGLLVQRMVRGERELLAGMKRDPVFGPCVTLGLGGVFTEALHDVSVRVAPFSESEAAEMLDELKSRRMFDAWRGLPPVNRVELARALAAVGEMGLQLPEIREIDVNPIIVDDGGRSVAVDALIVLGGGAS